MLWVGVSRNNALPLKLFFPKEKNKQIYSSMEAFSPNSVQHKIDLREQWSELSTAIPPLALREEGEGVTNIQPKLGWQGRGRAPCRVKAGVQRCRPSCRPPISAEFAPPSQVPNLEVKAAGERGTGTEPRDRLEIASAGNTERMCSLPAFRDGKYGRNKFRHVFPLQMDTKSVLTSMYPVYFRGSRCSPKRFC